MNKCLALLLVILACAGCGPLSSSDPAPKEYKTLTADGWSLSVLRYQPVCGADPQRPPVVLCHGLSYNSSFYDLAPAVSLARYLRDRGHDVWVPSLRGAGWSTKPPLSRLRQLFRGDLYTAGGVFSSGGKGLLKVNWTVDDHIRQDMPAILDLVSEHTGQRKVQWVGHSMGGMILVGYLAVQAQGQAAATSPATQPASGPAEDRIAGFVALGVPVFIEPPLSAPLAGIAKDNEVMAISNTLISTNLPAILGQIGGTALRTPIDVLFYNRANVSDDTVRRLNNWGTEDISPGQFGQLVDMVRGGYFRSTDGGIDYTAQLAATRTPALFLAGTVDNLATVESVKRLYRQWGAKDKQFVLLGAVNGQAIDYGHDDLVIGKNARYESYPVIEQWLRAKGR